MLEYFSLNGLDTYSSPMIGRDGQMIHGVNVTTFPLGGISKRPGYTTFLGTADGSQVNSLFYYPQQSGTQMFLHRASGSSFYYSQQGTGAWTLAGNGTIAPGAHVGAAILNNIFIIGDGAGSTRYTSNGTAFTNATLAPVGQYLSQYGNRIYITDGISSVITYSSAGSADNWSITSPADSSSFVIPDEGAAGPLFVAGDRLDITKTKGKMFQWDQNNLVDMTTKYGPTMPWAISSIDSEWFWANQYGVFMYDGNEKQLISNAVQRQFYNRQNTGMPSTQIGPTSSACGAAHIWDYFLTIGTITDDFVGRQITNAILKYDYQKNTFVNWQLNDTPTAMLGYTDANNQKQLIFGNSSGQCFKLDPTATSDNGKSIPTDMVFVFNYAAQQQQFSQTSASSVSEMSYEKKWNWFRAFLNPGCEINVQFSFSNSFTYQHLKWSDPISTSNLVSSNIATFSDGVFEIRFPNDQNNPARSRFLFVRFYENSDNSQWTLYGMAIDATPNIVQ